VCPANGGPWKKVASRKGCILKIWRPSAVEADNPLSLALKTDELLALVTPRTRLVAFTACSNILGCLVDVAEVVRALRAKAAEVGAKKVETCVDCVAYAPHRQIDVRKWDVDYCFFSYYKVHAFAYLRMCPC
jgi:selenocysteine lyase/cysteine desulfurase